MKRISQTPKVPYAIQQDTREDPGVIGKYLYIGALVLFVSLIIHTLYGHWYILQGNGFIYSDNQSAALEFDATIRELFILEGQKVEKGAILFTFDSFSLKSQLIQSAYQISALQQNYFAAEQSLIQLTSQIQSTKKFTQFSQKLIKSLDELLDQKVISPLQMSPDAQRLYEAMSSLASYEAEYQQTLKNLSTVRHDLQKAQQYYDELLKYYEEGVFKASDDGVITNLIIWPGAVLNKGQVAFSLFHGKRYILAYANTETLVSYKVGDKLIVSINGAGMKVAKIARLFDSSERLPEEFQPPFKPTQRNQLMAIELLDNHLESLPIMSTVQLSKPLGFGLISWIF